MRQAAFVVCALLSATAAHGQRVPSDELGRRVQVGDRARIRAAQRDPSGRRIDCEGRVIAVVGDTIVVENGSRWGTCPRRVYDADALSRAEVSYRDRGSRFTHAAIGLGAGVLVGGGAARLLVGDGCSPGFEGCDGGLAVALVTITGLIGGGVVGGIIGAALPAGPAWRPLSTPVPVRVAGLALRPSVRLSVRQATPLGTAVRRSR